MLVMASHMKPDHAQRTPRSLIDALNDRQPHYIHMVIMFATTDCGCSPVSTAILGLESGPLFVRADRTDRPEVIRTEEGRGGGAASAAIRIWPLAARKKAL